MSQMVAYARVTANNEDYVQFNPLVLHPFDTLKVVLEQCCFADYIKFVTDKSDVYNDIYVNLRTILANMPGQISYAQYGPVAELYGQGLAIAHGFLVSPNTLNRSIGSVLFNIFNTNVDNTRYINGEYVPTINEQFLTEYLALRFDYVDSIKHPTGVVAGALFVPRLDIVLNRDPMLPRTQNNNFQVVCTLEPHEFDSFKLTDPNTQSFASNGLCQVLARLDMHRLHIDDLLPIISSFSLEHEHYGMTNLNSYHCTVADVCFDLVTESAYTSVSTGLSHIQGIDDFINLCKYKLNEGSIQNVRDYALFGELLKLCGENQEISNYFTKPIASIESAEAFAFRNSVYATFISDRFESGMEAISDDAENADTGSNEGEPVDENEKESTGNDSDTGDAEPNESVDDIDDSTGKSPDEVANEGSEDNKEKDIHKPSIDPKMMLLEMASPDESLSDYIFRETVSLRIDNLLRNPPENARPNDLLMLKRWRSSWMWLTSISCLRDFLTRVSLRLSNP